MPKLCPHCGRESTDDQICSWCGKSLAKEAPAGAAAALVAAETARRATPQWPLYLAYVGSVLLIIVAGSAGAAKMAGKPPQEPGEWQAVNSENEYLSLSVPDNWQFRTLGSRGGFERVRIKSGKLCLVEIKGTQFLGAFLP